MANEGFRVLTEFRDDDLAALRDATTFQWLDLIAPDADTVEHLGKSLEWHPLLVEDIIHGGQRPKIDDYGALVLVVAYGAELGLAGAPSRVHEVAVVVHGSYVVTVHREPLSSLERLQEDLGSRGQVPEASVVYRVLDVLVDSTMAAVSDLADDIERIEDAITEKLEDTLLGELRAHRRELIELRSIAVAQRGALREAHDPLSRIPGLDLEMRDYFRDVSDHAYRVVDTIDVSRDVLDGAFEAYFAMLAAKQGVIVQRLAVMSTIFLPLTFVTGFFGQNFGWMVENVDTRADFLTFGVGGTVLCAVILGVTFRRLQWW